MDIFTKSPGERYEEVFLSGASFVVAGELGVYTLLRADLPGESVEYFVMDGGLPVAAAFLAPWDEPEGFQVQHASVAPTHRNQGLVRQLYVHLIERGVTLVSDSERSPDAERLWRWLAASGEVSLSLLPAVPEEGAEGEVPVGSLSVLEEIEHRDEWHYVVRSSMPTNEPRP